MKCIKCGAENIPDARYCYQCGQEFPSAQTACPNCHAQVLPGATFCSHCGQPLKPAPAPAQAPAPAGDEKNLSVPPPGEQPPGGAPPRMQPAGAPPPGFPLVGAQPPAGGAPVVMQTVVGNKNILLNLQNINGSQIDIDIKAPEEPSVLDFPVVARPAPFPDLLDRQPELQDVARMLESRAPVEISGEPGLGKTSLLRAVGNSPSADVTRFPSGIVYHRAYCQPEADLLQSLFSLFYQLPNNYKPFPEEVHRGLHGLQALLLLDDVTLTSDQLTDLRNQAPNCTFVLATSERALRGEGKALALGGLPPAEGLALIERELGRALTPQEQSAARQLCAALKGNPDRLLKTAERVQAGQAIESILQALAQTPLTPILLAGLSNPEMRVLSVVALGRGAAVPLEHLAPLAGLPDASLPLQTLQQRRLVQAHSPSYSLTGSLAQELWRDWDLTPWAEQALNYFIQWAEAQRADPRRLFNSIDLIMNLLEWAVSKQRWAQVLRLGRAIQVALALGLRWGAWLQVLTWVLTAARALGERSAEGWALHQIGTHALAVGDRQAALTFLNQALQLRQAIGDMAGLAVTQHNLNILLGLLPPPSQGQPPTPQQPPAAKQLHSAPSPAASPLMWILPLIGVTAVAAIIVISVIAHPWTLFTSHPTETPPPISTLTRRILTPSDTPTPYIKPLEPSRTPTPTITVTGTPAPELVFALESGCDRQYPPGNWQVFTYLPNLDGWVTVSLDGEVLPDVNQHPVYASVQYSGSVLIPRLPGEHVLSAFYDLGPLAITRECRFTVGQTITPTPPPNVDLWLDPGGCGGQYGPFDSISIHVLANQDGRVDFTVRPAAGASDAWYPIGDYSSVEVRANEEAKLGWQSPGNGNFGTWILKASLNDGAAEATCELQVNEKNPPTLQELVLVPRLPCEDQVVDAFVMVMDDSGIDTIKLFYKPFDSFDYSEVEGSRIDDFSYQFTFYAPKEGGSQFYVEIWDVYGNVTSTQAQPNAAYSGFVSSGFDYESYCNAYLIWPNTDLFGMDLPYTPPVVNNMYECMTQCLYNLSCQSFTWDDVVKGCWLKDGVPARSPKESCTSGKEFTVPIP